MLTWLRLAGWTAVGLFCGSLLWVGLYRFTPPPGTLTMLARKMSGDVIVHPWTPLRDISPNLVLAVMAGEDTRFCEHDGFDVGAIEKAMHERRSGRRRRGASTISQQTAKNAFLWNGGGWIRKGVEAWFTFEMETLWSKRRIMEVYLNIAEWGDGDFGAEAAAKAHFGKSAKYLTKDEAALLAAVLPSPNRWRVSPPGPFVAHRAWSLRRRMDELQRDGLAQCVLSQKRR